MQILTPRQLPLPLRLNDEATFANFLAAADNHQLLKHLSAAEEPVNRFIWLWGSVGAGQTHLLQALCHQNEDRNLQSVYIPLSAHQELHPQILENLDSVDLVCLDDLDQVAGLDTWETALFNLYNQLADSGTRLIVAARQVPSQTAWLLPDLSSRFQSGLVFQLHPLKDDDKLLALQLRAQGRGFDLPAEVASYLLLRTQRDMGSLFAVLQQLDDLSLEKKRRITIPLLKELL
jgi:DnaA-homolog protein